MTSLKQRLNQAGYICDDRFAAAVNAALATQPVAGAFLFGPIGTGKSYLPEVLAGVLDAEYYFYQCFPGTREDDLLVKMLPSEQTVSGVALHDGVMMQAVAATQRPDPERKIILVLDEWDKTRPSADSFLLDFLQTGRVNFNGRQLRADLSRLIVFLTFNIEREISEPLLRRLPKIDFQHLPPNLVHKALQLTHRDHPFLHNAVVLYERCLLANLPKPATIQELRQFLDAITSLGRQADWDALVYQFVTKTEENHELLRRAEKEKSRWQRTYRPQLDVSAYNVKDKPFQDEANRTESASLPSLRDLLHFDESIQPASESPDLSASNGLVELTHSSYNEVVRLLDRPGESPDQLGDIAEIRGGYINLTREVPLRNLADLSRFWGENGEVLVREPLAVWEDVKALQTWAPIQIVKFSRQEILAKADGLDLRWTPENGAEIIVDLSKRHVFEHCFGESWGRSNEAKWIGVNGLIYKRYQALEQAREGRDQSGERPIYCHLEADCWGGENWDSRRDADIPLFDGFVRETYEFSRQDGWKRFWFDGLEIAFKDTVTKTNDCLRVSIDGKFAASLTPYLREWLPRGELPFSFSFSTTIAENDLLRRHGFTVSPENSQVSVRRAGDYTLTYSPLHRIITVVRTLAGEQVAKPEIDRTIDDLAAFQAELSC